MTQDECEKQKYAHNNRSRDSEGFYCYICENFFDNNSPTYRRYELPFEYWMVIHNIGVEYYRANKPIPSEVKELKDKLKDAQKLNDDELEKLLFDANVFAAKHGKNKNSAVILLTKEKEIKNIAYLNEYKKPEVMLNGNKN